MKCSHTDKAIKLSCKIAKPFVTGLKYYYKQQFLL